MKNQIDWSEWILQKNNEAKQEELKKSDDVTLSKGAPALALPPEGGDGEDKPKKGASVFNMGHVKHAASMTDHGAAKQFAHSLVDASSARPENKKKIKMMINQSRSPGHLAQAMANHVLAHPGEGLKVIKSDSLDKAAKDAVGDDVDSSMLTT
jgi:hypothetical protein